MRTTLRSRSVFGRVLTLGGLLAALNACGSGGGGGGRRGFDELLFVTDEMTVRSFSVSGTNPDFRHAATIPGISGTYSRSGNLVTVNMVDHEVDGEWINLDFGPGTGGTATDGVYLATAVDDDVFTVLDSAAGGITDGTLLRIPSISFSATYVQSGTTVTITLANHELDALDSVELDYTSGSAVDANTTIDTVPDANTFTVEAAAPLDTSGSVTVVVGNNYTIFGMAMHPNGRWLYVTSEFDCSNGRPYCWAGDLISRFSIDWDSAELEFEESVRSTDGDVSSPAPVTLVFSDDGTRLFHQDDDLDGLRMWDVDPFDGSLTLLASSGANTTTQHGVAVSSDATRVYHGARAFAVGTSPDSLALISAVPPGGEANRILGGTLFAIIGGQTNAQVRAYSLADPDAPLQVAASPNSPHQVRDFALADGGALIVTSGFGGLKSYDFDGANITPSVGIGDTELRDGGDPFPAQGALARVYRTISLNADEDLVAAAYFTNHPDAGNGGIPPSGFILANVSADGTLSLAADFAFATYARIARFFQKP